MSNFLSLLAAVSFSIGLAGCQALQQRTEPKTTTKRPTQSDVPAEVVESVESVTEEVPPRVVERQAPKVGLILGAGGVKAFAHVGVLKALEDAKIPVHAMVGLEWGSLVGALYAANGSANDLEWQLFKMKDEDVFDVGLLGASKDIQPSKQIKPFLQKVLGSSRIDGMRIPMACPTKSLLTEAFFWMDEGSAASVVRLCMSYPPFFESTQNRYAAVDAVAEAATRLRKQGAELVIFINVLEAGPLFTKNSPGYTDRDVMLWQGVRKDYKRAKNVVDEVIGVYIDDVGINDFAKRRQVVGQAQNAAEEVARSLVEKYGF